MAAARRPAPALAVAFVKPAVGSSFTTQIVAGAKVASKSTVRRVEFWLDAKRIGRDRRAPYTVSYTVPTSLSLGTHTLSVRAYNAAGAVTSSAITVNHVKSGTAARTAAPLTASVSTFSSKAGGTDLDVAGAPVTAALAPCSGGRSSRQVRLTPRTGAGMASHARESGLCVTTLTAVS